MDTTTLVNMLFSGSTALAGLILVFLGGTINSFDSYSPLEKSSVRKKYHLRAWFSFAGFIFAILSALSALAWNWIPLPLVEYISLTAILISFIFVIVLAALSVKEV